MPGLPTGTVTFLFTDIEGSTTLLQRLGDRRYAEILAEHQRLLREAFAGGNGQEIDTQGDAFLVAFSRARDAVATAVVAQRTLTKHAWPDGAALRVRMGLHTGEPLSGETGYVGIDVHRAARIAAAGHGGQIVISQTVGDLAARDLPAGVSLRDLGNYRLKDLGEPEHLFQVVHPDLPGDFPPLKSLDARPNNLPSQLTNFVGREREIAEVKRLLGAARLVTLTGSGGAGKTRLALQVAADVVEGYPDGVWLVEFAPVADPILVPKTVASALNVPEQPGRDITETLVDTLRSKVLLLVLDNCEHLLGACRDLAVTLLRLCPHTRILATSREGLGVPGETLWRVPSLSVPEDVRHLPPPEELVLYDAVRLFADRAVATTPGFTLTRKNAAAVTQVCQRLDGIPLAIELAAARVKVLAVEQIASRLDDRFRLLTGGSLTVLPRHQTLGAAIDWSYNLLSEAERMLLRRLSVFAGGWTLEAAESVGVGGSVEAVGVLDLLTSLVDKSLVLAETQSGDARYRLLETVRQYARDRLQEAGEEAEVRTRHRDWYLALAEQAEAKLPGHDQKYWERRLEMDHDNLRAALEWSVGNGETEVVLRLAKGLYEFWNGGGYWSESLRWLEAGLSPEPAVSSSLRAWALYAAGVVARRLGDIHLAVERLEESVATYRTLGDKRGVANALVFLGTVAYRGGDYSRAAALLEEGISLSQKSDDKPTLAWLLYMLGIVARIQGDYPRAKALLEQSLAISRALGLKRRIALVTDVLGLIALGQGDYERARSLCREALTLHQQEGYSYGIVASLNSSGLVSCVQGDWEQAKATCDESLVLARELGEKGAMARSLYVLGRLAHCQSDDQRAAVQIGESLALFRELGEKLGVAQCLERLGGIAASAAPQRAARLLGAAEALREAIGVPLPTYDRADYDRAAEGARAAVTEPVFATAWAEGRAMTLEQAIEYALREA